MVVGRVQGGVANLQETYSSRFKYSHHGILRIDRPCLAADVNSYVTVATYLLIIIIHVETLMLSGSGMHNSMLRKLHKDIGRQWVWEEEYHWKSSLEKVIPVQRYIHGGMIAEQENHRP